MTRDTIIAELKKAIQDAGIKADLGTVGMFYDMPKGRKWDEIPDADLILLYDHTIGGKPLPLDPPVQEDPPF